MQSQNCYPNGVTLETQEEVDAFSTASPACTNIQGDLIIKGNVTNAITDLSGLSQIEFVGGDLKVLQNISLTSLQGLHMISVVNGNVEIKSNNVLGDLTGLAGLTSIGGNLNLQSLSLLANLDGLQNVHTISGDLNIQSLSQLTNLEGLENLGTIGSTLSVFSCSSLLNFIGLGSVSSIGGLNVNSCPTFVNFEGIGTITTLDGSLSVTNNSNLENFIGLNDLTTIGDDLTIRSNRNMLNLNGLSKLKNVGATVSIKSNQKLTTLHALRKVTTIGENYYIEANAQLAEIVGFLSTNQLTSVGERLWIKTNPSLTSLNGFNTIDFVGISLHIFNNNALSTISGFNSLMSVPRITINQNDDLLNISGFGGINTIESILITRNNMLGSISGFSSLDTTGFLSVGSNDVINTITFSSLNEIKDDCTITFNPLLTNINLPSLKTIRGDLEIVRNDALTSFSSIEQLETISGNLRIESNTNLNAINGLSSLSKIEGNLTLFDLPNLQEVGLSALTEVGDEFDIRNCVISSFAGLEALKKIGKKLTIISNEMLVNLQGFNNIDSIIGSIRIEFNNNLESLEGLDNAFLDIDRSFAKLKIWNNPLLSICNANALCNFMHDFPSTLSSISIYKNAPGCNSTLEIIESCCTHPDYGTLVNLFFYNIGFDWTSSTGWIQDCDPCGITSGTPWQGVSCNQDNRVIALDLSDNELSGALYSLIDGLTFLESLNLSNNSITDTLPLALFELDSLQVLNLSNNKMIGEIPKELANLLHLKELYVDNNDFRGCFHQDLMSLCGTLVSSDVNEGNDFYSEWDDFCSSGLGACCHYDFIALEKIHEEMGGLSWANDDGWLTDCDPCGVSSGTSWNGVKCQKNRVTHIDLSANNLQNQLPQELSLLAFLDTLDLRSNVVSGEIPIEVYGLVALELLNLSNNSMSGEIPLDIQKLRKLKILEIQNNQFSGTLSRGFGILSAYGDLNHLNVENNQFSGCFDGVLSNLCNGPTSMIDCNGTCNNFDSSWSEFCVSGTGTCDPCGDITWIGSTGFQDGEWNKRVNWDRLIVPEDCHNVHIPSGHAIVLFANDQACLGTLEIMSGSLFEARLFSQMNVQDSTCQPPEEFIIDSPINQKK